VIVVTALETPAVVSSSPTIAQCWLSRSSSRPWAYRVGLLRRSDMSGIGWIVLQNDFEPWSEENFFQIEAE
jgi:hypothetical protein